MGACRRAHASDGRAVWLVRSHEPGRVGMGCGALCPGAARQRWGCAGMKADHGYRSVMPGSSTSAYRYSGDRRARGRAGRRPFGIRHCVSPWHPTRSCRRWRQILGAGAAAVCHRFEDNARQRRTDGRSHDVAVAASCRGLPALLLPRRTTRRARPGSRRRVSRAHGRDRCVRCSA